MSPDELRETLDALRWSQRGLAEILGLHPTTVRRWATGVTTIPHNVSEWLYELAIVHRQRPTPRGWYRETGGGVPLIDLGPLYREELRDRNGGPMPVSAGPGAASMDDD